VNGRSALTGGPIAQRERTGRAREGDLSPTGWPHQAEGEGERRRVDASWCR
jgi:hypothetical protein